MPRFNFTNITLQSKADITDVMDNFNKIETYGITESEVNSKIATVNGTISSVQTNLSRTATTSSNGMMSAADKQKLNGIQANANNYILPQASYGYLGGVISGSNVANPSGYTPTPIINGVPYYKDTNTTYSNATSSSNGLMSSTDKAKLDTVASYANNYTLPTAGSNLGGVKTTSNVSSIDGYTPVPIINGVPYYKDTNTTYNNATTSVAGLMSALDKAKLDGVQAGATANIIIDNLTTESPTAGLSAKQGKALNELINGKQKNISSGTAAPSGGVDGDIYIQYFD